MLPGFYDVIHRRRDVRAEFSGEPVDEDVLVRVLDAAHSAPSVGLSQPWDFILVSDESVRRAFWSHVQEERREFAASLEGERAERFAGIKIDGILEASLSVVVTYDPARGAPGVLGRHAIADAGLYSVCLAIENMWLACTAEGWGMGWVSFYRESFLRGSARHPGPDPTRGVAVRRTGGDAARDARTSSVPVGARACLSRRRCTSTTGIVVTPR